MIKQYGSLTLNLNTVKLTYNSFRDELLIWLYDGNHINLQKEWHSQFQNDYLNFTLQKKAQIIKEAFEYVWDGNWEVYRFQIPFNIRNKDIRIDIYPSGMSVSCGNVKVEPVNFNFNSTDKATWISYAQQIKDTYLDSIVDPVKVAEEVLKFRGLDKEWQVNKYYTSVIELVNTNNNEITLYGCGSYKLAVGINNNPDYFIYYPSTNSEWVNAIEFALDKYYENQQLFQPTEVDLKLMLGKALKDNGLVAKEVTIPNHWCKAIIKVAPTGFIKWVQITGEDCIRCNFDGCNDIKYSLPNSLEDWQTIFSDSLAQYKKLVQPKLTKDDIVECLKSALEGQYVQSAKYILDDFLGGTIEVKLVEYSSLIWEIKETVKCKNHKDSCGFAVYLGSPKTKEDWITAFKVSLEQLLPVSKEPELTLLDLLEKAFTKFEWDHVERDNYHNTFEGKNFLFSIKVISSIKAEEIISFTLFKRNSHLIYRFDRGVITKQRLVNCTGWQEWLEEVIKSKTNLDNLVSNPIVKAEQQPQRVSNLTSTTTDNTLKQLADDPWL